MSICYINGRIIPLNKVSVGLTDLGLLRGYGVFDFLRTYNGKIFLFDEHLKRFRNSAKILNLEIVHTDDEIKDIFNELLAKNNFKESNIKILLTGDLEDDDKTNLYVLVTKLEKPADSLYSEGVKVITHDHKREFPQAKTTNYMMALSLKKWQKKEGAFEILYTYRGSVLEATTSNFFIIQNNKLITPKEDILLGTTRNLLVKIAKKYFDVEEREIKTTELKEISEAFITGTNKELIPIVDIDGKKVGDGIVGNKTKTLMKAFRNYTLTMD